MLFFFFNDTATTEIYTLSLHDALPISSAHGFFREPHLRAVFLERVHLELRARNDPAADPDRKSTRLNSSHSQISYAVFCLKKKKKRHPALTTISQHRIDYARCPSLSTF